MEHNETGCQPTPEGPLLCINKCGFFGSAATMNMCSKCHKDLAMKEQQSKLAASSIENIIVNGSTIAESATVKVQVDDIVHVKVSPISIPNPSEASSTSEEGSIGTKSKVGPIYIPNPPEASSFEEGIIGAKSKVGPISIPNPPEASSSDEGNIGTKSKVGPSRCSSCKKRVGLTGFKCKCGDLFCGSHRYSDKHDCPYDYRTAARDAIAKANPVVKAEKLEKI